MAERRPFPLRLYRFLMTAATPLAPLLFRYRLRRNKEDPNRLRERRGLSRIARPRGTLVWIHCASVGELNAVMPLIERLCQRVFVLVTSGTVTSAELAASRLPKGALHQFIPLDSPIYVHRFFNHWQPDLGLFVESDLWPNLLLTAAERKTPLILLNGRLSERSFRRWQSAPATVAALFGAFDLCLAQSPADAQRLSDLGAPRFDMTGNLKLDVPAPDADSDECTRLRNAIGSRPVFAAASTHPGEEQILFAAHRALREKFPHLMTILAPRHPQRGGEIEMLAKVAGLRVTCRSRGALPARETDIYIADTLGELGLVYRLAPIVFMGGSLVPHGGQNPIEAAKLDTATVHGPFVSNFADIYQALDSARGSALVADGDELVQRVNAWLTDPAARQTTAEAGRIAVEKLGGALARTMAALEPYLMQLQLAQERRKDRDGALREAPRHA